jgi:hypothetical protein
VRSYAPPTFSLPCFRRWVEWSWNQTYGAEYASGTVILGGHHEFAIQLSWVHCSSSVSVVGAGGMDAMLANGGACGACHDLCCRHDCVSWDQPIMRVILLIFILYSGPTKNSLRSNQSCLNRRALVLRSGKVSGLEFRLVWFNLCNIKMQLS